MDLCKFISLLVIFWSDLVESGGHHDSKHDHLKVHVPEFIHHNHHTKYITIHHHHHKPEKHHHHIHIPKSHKPYGHHYGVHKHKKGTTTLTTTTVKGGHGHGHHGHKGHHGHHGHHKHHHPKHHGHHHKHHDPYPAYDGYDTPAYAPHVPHIPQIPHSSYAPSPNVRGVTHTVKQVKVFDSLPGAIPNLGNGYEVTENNDGDEDSFSVLGDLPETYPSTYNFVRSAAAPINPYPALPTQDFQPHVQDNFVPIPSTGSTGNSDVFANTASHDPFSDAPESIGSTADEIPVNFDTIENHDGFDSSSGFAGTAPSAAGSFLADEENLHENTPVTFAREAGIQHKVTTGGHETVTY